MFFKTYHKWAIERHHISMMLIWNRDISIKIPNYMSEDLRQQEKPADSHKYPTKRSKDTFCSFIQAPVKGNKTKAHL